MTQPGIGPFKLDEFEVLPDLDQIRGPQGAIEVEPKTMAVLLALAHRAGDVISADELIESVWQGRPMGDNPVYKSINKLRKALGDNAQAPRFIATVPKKGYRLLVTPLEEDNAHDYVQPGQPIRLKVAGAAMIAAVALLSLVFFNRGSDPVETEEPPVGPSSIAVLEFSTLDGDQEYPDVAGGIADEIRIQLSRIQGLSVVSRNASQALNTQILTPTPKDIRSALRVAYVLEGTVRVVNRRLHYTAQLINTGTGYDIWAASDTRDYSDVLEIQADIANAVVGALRAKLSRDLATPKRSTNSVEAYSEFRLGQSYMSRPLTPEFLEPAEAHFKNALSLDPNYARAHAGMCQVLRRWYRYSKNVIYLDQAVAACKRAADIDPELSEVPLALGHLYRDLGRYEDAVGFYKQAISLNPTEMEGYQGMALAYGKLGQPQKSRELFESAIELFSSDPAGYARYATFLYRRAEYESALANFQKAFELGWTNTTTLNSLAASYYILGDFEMAARTWSESLEKQRTFPAISGLATAYFYLGRIEEAVEHYRQAVALSPTDYTAWTSLAIGLRQMPDTDNEVRDVCSRAVELGVERLALNPDDAVALSYIAPCRIILGQRDLARQSVDRALELAPENTIVLFNVITALIDLGALDDASKVANRVIELGFPRILLCTSPELSELPRDVCASSASVAN